MKNRAILLIFLSLLTACSAVVHHRSVHEPTVGIWRLYETGNTYSGGFTYAIKPISSSPLQTIRLKSSGQFRANVQDPFFKSLYSSVRAYRVEKLTTDTNTYSIVYRTKKQASDSEFRQGLVLRHDTLRLNPLCFEGCHFSFVRVR